MNATSISTQRGVAALEDRAERAVLGALLTRADALECIEPALCAEDFASRRNSYVYAALREVDNATRCDDRLAVAAVLERDGRLAQCGGVATLDAIALEAAAPGDLQRCAAIVRERAVVRRLRQAGEDIARTADGAGDMNAKLDRARMLVDGIAGNARRSTARTLAEILPEASELLDRRARGVDTGLATGWLDLDRLTGGLRGGQLVILAARPGMGKTAAALQLALHVAREGHAVRFHSFEMSATDLLLRAVGTDGDMPVQALVSGQPDAEILRRYVDECPRLAPLPLSLDDAPGLSVYDIRASARRMHREHGLALLIVDYLQLLEGEGDNRTQQLAWISRQFKLLALELAIPVLLVSQLNRNLEYRDNKRPVMSDLRESGGLEQDADLILFVYRDVVYNPDTPAPEGAEVIIGKQRNGPLGTVYLTYSGESCRFESGGAPPPPLPPPSRSRRRTSWNGYPR